MTVSILGCGWFGMNLARSLSALGIYVKASTTTPSKLAELSTGKIKAYLVHIRSGNESISDPGFFECDTLVIANNVKMNNPGEYLSKIHQTISLIKQHAIRSVVFISSSSVYGDPNSIVNELTAPAPESGSGKMLYTAECLFQNEPSFACTILRCAGLVGPGRDPANFFPGKTGIPNGLAPVNLVHLDDCTALTQAIITKPVGEPIINVVSPHHPPKMEFYTLAAQKKGLITPSFVSEKNKWKVVESLMGNSIGYVYTIHNWIDWLIAK